MCLTASHAEPEDANFLSSDFLLFSTDLLLFVRGTSTSAYKKPSRLKYTFLHTNWEFFWNSSKSWSAFSLHYRFAQMQ